MKQRIKYTRFLLLLIFGISLFILPGKKLIAQSLYLDKSFLEEDDVNKIEKYEEVLAKADADLQEANQLYMELSQLELDYSLTTKELEKKSEQTQFKANKLEVDALTVIDETNGKIWAVYSKYAKSDDAELNESRMLQVEQARGYWEITDIKRKDAARAKNLEGKIQLLGEAIDNSNLAISTMILAVGTTAIYPTITNQAETPVQETVNVPDEQNYVPEISQSPTTTATLATGAVVVDQSMLNKYNDYVTDPTIPDPITLNRDGVSGMDDFTIADAETVWNTYNYDPVSIALLAQESDSMAPIDVASSESENLQNEYSSPDASTQASVAYVSPEPIVVTGPETEFVADQYIYRVQIAANTTQLSQRAMMKMYEGNKKVEMIEEKGWYKYSIGDFDNYQQADKFRKDCGVPKAFIVKYARGKEFAQVPATQTNASVTEKFTTYQKPQSVSITSDLLFSVQIAASKSPLSRSQLQSIYKGTHSITVIMEDGWYKYQIEGIRLYTDAKRIRRECAVNGAFIVAYENSAKVNLNLAIEKNKELQEQAKQYGREIVNEIDFYIQLAASKNKLTEAIISNLNPQGLPVRIIIEEDWFKYQIPAGTSYQQGKEKLNSSTTTGAFLVAYKQGSKMKLYNAKQESEKLLNK